MNSLFISQGFSESVLAISVRDCSFWKFLLDIVLRATTASGFCVDDRGGRFTIHPKSLRFTPSPERHGGFKIDVELLEI